MSVIEISTAAGSIKILINPSANFGQCALQAALASAPVFIQELLACLGGGGGTSGDYKPGDRDRCTAP